MRGNYGEIAVVYWDAERSGDVCGQQTGASASGPALPCLQQRGEALWHDGAAFFLAGTVL